MTIAGLRTAILILTGFYLAGPLLIASELLKPAFSIPLLLLFAAWFWTLAMPTSSSSKSLCESGDVVSNGGRGSILGQSAPLAACLLLCLVWVYLSGIGGFAYCRSDYIKHNLIFSYLMEGRLPLKVPFKGREFLLHYAFAYYITPVRITELAQQIFNININLNLVLSLGYSVIIFLSLILLAMLHRISALWLGIIVAITGGLDALGRFVFGTWAKHLITIPYLNIDVIKSLEWWGTPAAPGNLTTALFWAPQHFFGALVGTALLYAFLQSPRSSTVVVADTVILVGASALWSPYVAVGLAILLLLELSSRGVIQRFREERLASLLSAQGLIAYAFAVVLCVFVWLYYAAAGTLSSPRLLLGAANLVAWLLTYILNYAPFLLGLILVSVPQAWEGSSKPSEEQRFRRRLFWRLAAGLAASAGLLSLSHGTYNDWAMRTTLPLSLMLAITITQVTLSRSLKQRYRTLLLGVLVLSTGSALNDFAGAIMLDRNCAPYGAYQLEDLGQLASQYQGRRNSFLYSYLVRWR